MRKYRNFALFLLLAFVLVARSRECAVFASTPPVLYLSGTATITAVQGGSSSNSYKVTTGGSFSGLVTLTCAGLPSGVTASWSLSSFTPAVPSSITYSTLTFQVASSVKPGWYGYTVTAAGDGLSVQWAYALIVNQAGGVNASVSATTFSMESMGSTTLNVIATPVGGVSTTTALTKPQIVGGLPTGVTATWGIPAISPAGVVTCPLSLAGSTAAVGGTSSLQFSVTVTDKNTGISYSATTNSSLTIYFNTPSLQLSAASTQSVLLPGQSISDVFTVKTAGSFHGAISLSVAGLPSGVTATWSQSSFTPSSATSTTTSTLTFQVASSVKPGWYGYTVTAAGDGLSVQWAYALIVNQAGGVNASVSATTFSMESMGSTTLNVIATPVGGVSTTAALTNPQIVSGLPTGVTATWGTAAISPAGVVTCPLSLTGSTAAVGGTSSLQFSVTVTDKNTGISYSATTNSSLTIYFNTPSLQLSAASTKSVLLPGQSISDVFTVKTAGSFHGAISLSVAGLPSGVTATWSQSSFTPSSATSTTTSTLTFNVPSSVQPSWYLYSVTAVGDGLSVTWTFGLVVEPAVGMGLAVSTITPMVNAGQSTAMTVTIVPKNGITVASGSPTASITSTLPAGITATFGTPVTNSNGSISWTLTLSASSSAAIGDVPFTLQAGITDTVSGEPYSLSQQLNLLVSTLATIVPNTTAGSPMPAGFLGLYNEWWCAQNVMGSTATGVNTVYRKLISNLTAYNTGTLNYRVGGDSTDKTTEPISTTAVPFAQLSAAVPVDFDLGVNLGSDNVALAVDQANAYISQMPTGSLQYIEIGNEPNFYASHGLRSPSYTYTDYLADDTNWNDHLTPVLPPGVKLMGPAWSTYQSPADAATFLANQPSAFGAYSIHYYAAASTPVPAADYLLTSAAATTLPSNVAGSVPEVHAAGAVYRIDEIGTQSGAGTAGLSNGFQSALWSLDVMFGLAQVGVDGVNWQTSPGNVSAPFVFNVTAVTSTTNSYALQSVSPLYYGLLLFQQATANQAKLVPVTVTTGANVTAWATLDSTEDEERVVILNKDEANSGKVALNAPGYTSATVTRLLAPSYSSTSGVTLGGQTFDGSSDGSIQGTLTQETYTSSNGQFEINMPTVSGAMVVLKP